MTFLEDDILRLRAVEPEDADMMWEVESDSGQWLENGMSAPYSRKNLRDYAETYDPDPIRAGQLRLVIERKDNGGNETIGLLDLYDISGLWRTAYVGIYILEKNRRKGYGRRALNIIGKYARTLLNLRILAAKVAESNSRSRTMFEDAGYSLSGEFKDWILSGETTLNLLIYTKRLSDSVE